MYPVASTWAFEEEAWRWCAPLQATLGNKLFGLTFLVLNLQSCPVPCRACEVLFIGLARQLANICHQSSGFWYWYRMSMIFHPSEEEMKRPNVSYREFPVWNCTACFCATRFTAGGTSRSTAWTPCDPCGQEDLTSSEPSSWSLHIWWPPSWSQVFSSSRDTPCFHVFFSGFLGVLGLEMSGVSPTHWTRTGSYDLLKPQLSLTTLERTCSCLTSFSQDCRCLKCSCVVACSKTDSFDPVIERGSRCLWYTAMAIANNFETFDYCTY